MSGAMLTTSDNPFNPHTHFDEWNRYDMQLGHHTLSFLARIVNTSPGLSEVDQEIAIDDAINEIVRENVSGNYEKIEPPSNN